MLKQIFKINKMSWFFSGNRNQRMGKNIDANDWYTWNDVGKRCFATFQKFLVVILDYFKMQADLAITMPCGFVLQCHLYLNSLVWAMNTIILNWTVSRINCPLTFSVLHSKVKSSYLFSLHFCNWFCSSCSAFHSTQMALGKITCST